MAAVMQIFFIDFHRGPPRTIWQGPRRPLHKWPLLKSAPGVDWSAVCRRRRSPWKQAPPMEPAKIALAAGNGQSASHPVDPVDVRRQQYQTPGMFISVFISGIGGGWKCPHPQNLQEDVDAQSINCFKNRLEKRRTSYTADGLL